MVMIQGNTIDEGGVYFANTELGKFCTGVIDQLDDIPDTVPRIDIALILQILEMMMPLIEQCFTTRLRGTDVVDVCKRITAPDDRRDRRFALFAKLRSGWTLARHFRREMDDLHVLKIRDTCFGNLARCTPEACDGMLAELRTCC